MKNLYSIMMRWGFVCSLMMMALVSKAQSNMASQQILQSPDGKCQFIFEQKDGKLSYRLNYADKEVIEEGELGVNSTTTWWSRQWESLWTTVAYGRKVWR